MSLKMFNIKNMKILKELNKLLMILNKWTLKIIQMNKKKIL